MATVKITCDTGRAWETCFNGSHEDAVAYFLGQTFTAENPETGWETRHTVVAVQTEIKTATNETIERSTK